MWSHSVLLVKIAAIVLSSSFANADFRPNRNRIAIENNGERIVGGETSLPGQFPYVASIRLMGIFFTCGGSIITNRWILTAGQCTFGWPVEVLTVTVGAHHIEDDGDDLDVERFVLHPEFAIDDVFFTHLENDIALVETVQTIVFSATVAPIAIGTNTIGAGIPAFTMGWGLTGALSDPEYLQYLSGMVTLNNLDCQSRKSQFSFLVNENVICAYSNHIGRGLCFGDTGGPLVSNDEVIGIVSFGESCAIGRPEGFTRVGNYAEWIEDTINE